MVLRHFPVLVAPTLDHLLLLVDLWRILVGGGAGGWKTGRKGGGRRTGGGRRGVGKRDSQGDGKREKKGKITQHCAIFCNRKNAKGREPKNTGREPGSVKGTGSGRFKPPCPPPPPTFYTATALAQYPDEKGFLFNL